MSRKAPDPIRTSTEDIKEEGFLGRRMRMFEERSRDPGDGTTWSAVLGALIFTLLIVCYSIADQPMMALVSLVLMFVWIGVMARFGQVNVASVLWGSSTTDFNRNPNPFVVYQSTFVVAIFGTIAMAVNAFQGWTFSWYGFALLATTAVFLVVYMRGWVQHTR